MKKRLISLFLILVLAATAPAMAKPKQMRDGVPVWNETTVKEYARQYVKGENLEKLLAEVDYGI